MYHTFRTYNPNKNINTTGTKITCYQKTANTFAIHINVPESTVNFINMHLKIYANLSKLIELVMIPFLILTIAECN